MINLQTPTAQALDTHLTVWMVNSKTSFTLFATEEMAKNYVSGFAASVGGGMHVSSVPVFGAAAPVAQQGPDAYIVRTVERAIKEATQPQGMGLYDGMARIPASILSRLLKLAQLAAPVAPAEQEWPAGQWQRKPITLTSDLFPRCIFDGATGNNL